MNSKKYIIYYLISLGIILLDQFSKYLVHQYMIYGSMGEIPIFGNWCKLHYTLNPGMAFGMAIGGEYGKLTLSIFSILAMVGIGFYLFQLIQKGVHWGLCTCMAMIFGGAVGNIIDRTFYGLLLDNVPEDSIMKLFHGQVIDMFYFDIWEGLIPHWIPFIGGHFYSLWPIFNIADSSIFTGVCIIFIFQKKFFAKPSFSLGSEVENRPSDEMKEIPEK